MPALVIKGGLACGTAVSKPNRVMVRCFDIEFGTLKSSPQVRLDHVAPPAESLQHARKGASAAWTSLLHCGNEKLSDRFSFELLFV
jgi:hypothetical protein